MRRNRLDICVDILEVSVGGANKTSVVVKSNLNFEIIKEYLNTLISSNFLTIDENGRYSTTNKGLKFIEDYYTLIESMNHKTPAGLSRNSPT